MTASQKASQKGGRGGEGESQEGEVCRGSEEKWDLDLKGSGEEETGKASE